MSYRKFTNLSVQHTFNRFPEETRNQLMFLRELIFQTAEVSREIGVIEETLKWDNPSYLTHSPKSGTTIRLSAVRKDENKYAISVHCQTTLIAEFKEIYPDLHYDGNRSIIFDVNYALPIETITHFITSALTYHLQKKEGIGL